MPPSEGRPSQSALSVVWKTSGASTSRALPPREAGAAVVWLPVPDEEPPPSTQPIRSPAVARHMKPCRKTLCGNAVLAMVRPQYRAVSAPRFAVPACPRGRNPGAVPAPDPSRSACLLRNIPRCSATGKGAGACEASRSAEFVLSRRFQSRFQNCLRPRMSPWSEEWRSGLTHRS